MFSVEHWLLVTAPTAIVGGVIEYFTKGLRRFGNWLGSWLAHHFTSHVSTKSLVFVKKDNKYENFWSIGTYSDEKKPCLDMRFKFLVTNLTDKTIYLAHGMVKGYEKYELTQHLMVKKSDTDDYGHYPILPHSTTAGHFLFISTDVSRVKIGQSLPVTIIIIDTLGEKHVLKNVSLIQAGKVG